MSWMCICCFWNFLAVLLVFKFIVPLSGQKPVLWARCGSQRVRTTGSVCEKFAEICIGHFFMGTVTDSCMFMRSPIMVLISRHTVKVHRDSRCVMLSQAKVLIAKSAKSSGHNCSAQPNLGSSRSLGLFLGVDGTDAWELIQPFSIQSKVFRPSTGLTKNLQGTSSTVLDLQNHKRETFRVPGILGPQGFRFILSCANLGKRIYCISLV